MARSQASGRTLPKLLAVFDQPSSSWRTSPPSSAGGGETWSGTLPKSGMTQGGSLFELPTLMLPISGTDGSASPTLPTPRASDGPHGGPNMRDRAGNYTALPGAVIHLLKTPSFFPTPTASDGTGGGGHQPQKDGWGEPENRGHSPADWWGDYLPAIRRWESVNGPAPAPTEIGPKGGRRLTAPFAEWMMGLPDGHVTAVSGLSRSNQLKAIGNGVVPRQAEMALLILLSHLEAQREAA